MGLSHHGDAEQLAHMRRLVEQIEGTAKRAYPAGRMGAEDDGALSYAMATDTRHGTIVVRFGKPVEWVGLGLEEATQLRDELTRRIMELRGVATNVQ
jgi:hypothetical protein